MSSEAPAKTRWGERHRVLGISVTTEEYSSYCQIAEKNRITPTQAFLQDLDKTARIAGEKQGYDKGFKEGQEVGYRAGKEQATRDIKKEINDYLDTVKEEGLGNVSKTQMLKFLRDAVKDL